MIPIVPIGNAVNFIVSSFIALKLYLSYRKSKEKKLGYFFRAMVFLSVFFLLLSTPELIFKNPRVIGLSIEISQFFVFLSLAYFSIIPLEILGWQRLRKFYFNALVYIALVIDTIIITSMGDNPALQVINPPFVYWESTRGTLISIIQGAILGLSILLAAIFFMINGMKSSERYIRIRAFIIAGGLIVLVLAAAMNYVWGAASENIVLPTIASNLASMFGLLIILAGIYYKKEEEGSIE